MNIHGKEWNKLSTKEKMNKLEDAAKANQERKWSHGRR